MDYQIIYEYQPTVFDWRHLFLYIIFIVLVFTIVHFIKRLKLKYDLKLRGLIFGSYALLCIAILLSVYLLYDLPKVIHNRNDFQNIIESKSYAVIEGETKDYLQADKHTREEHEQFSVNGILFNFYDYFVPMDSYHTPIDNRIIKKNGIKVRITYVNRDSANWIIKIEKSK